MLSARHFYFRPVIRDRPNFVFGAETAHLPVSFLGFSFLAQFRFWPCFVFSPLSFSAQSETEVSLHLQLNGAHL